MRRIRADEGLVLRELRLRSLADAPDAFGQTVDEARARPEVEWHREARQGSRGDSRSWFIAELDERPVGIVQGRRRRPHALLVFSMWVDPADRRRGVGRELITAVERWGQACGATETVLWVLAGNTAAIAFYARLGFTIDSKGADADSGARFRALAMRRPIDHVRS